MMKLFLITLICLHLLECYCVATEYGWKSWETYFRSAGNRIVSLKPEGEESPGNALYLDCARREDRKYWEILLKKDDENATEPGVVDVFVGLSTPENFKPGYKLKGLMYGGNLATGSYLLISNFGPRFSSGDRIGVLLDQETSESKNAKSVSIYFWINGRALGIAYHATIPNVPICPTLQFSSSGSATVESQARVPTNTDREEVAVDGVIGKWSADVAEVVIDGVKLAEISEERRHIFLELRRERSDGKLTVVFRYLNTMRGIATPTEAGYSFSGMTMTLIGGTPEVMRSEHLLHSFMKNMTNLERKDDKLLLEAGKDSIEFSPAHTIIQPVEDPSLFTPPETVVQ